MGDFNAQVGNRTHPMETATGKNCARIEKRKKRHLGRMGNTKKVQNNEYRVSEESREEMDTEKPKRCNEDRN